MSFDVKPVNTSTVMDKLTELGNIAFENSVPDYGGFDNYMSMSNSDKCPLLTYKIAQTTNMMDFGEDGYFMGWFLASAGFNDIRDHVHSCPHCQKHPLLKSFFTNPEFGPDYVSLVEKLPTASLSKEVVEVFSGLSQAGANYQQKKAKYEIYKSLNGLSGTKFSETVLKTTKKRRIP